MTGDEIRKQLVTDEQLQKAEEAKRTCFTDVRTPFDLSLEQEIALIIAECKAYQLSGLLIAEMIDSGAKEPENLSTLVFTISCAKKTLLHISRQSAAQSTANV